MKTPILFFTFISFSALGQNTNHLFKAEGNEQFGPPKVVPMVSSKGFKFEKVEEFTDGRITWKDMSADGLTWYPLSKDCVMDGETKLCGNSITWPTAFRYCEIQGRRLPTKLEVETAEKHGFREVAKFEGYSFWTSEEDPRNKTNPKDPKLALLFHTPSGQVKSDGAESSREAVICVNK